MKNLFVAAALSVGLLAQSAYAQLPPVIYNSQAYVPMTGGTPVTFSNGSGDDSAVDLPLGFSFPYLGTNYTTIRASTNGILTFGTTTADPCLSGGCYSNEAIPTASTGVPTRFIAPWWDDHEIKAGTVVTSRTAAGEFEIEYANLQPHSTLEVWQITFKVKLTSAGTIFIHYGANNGNSVTPSGGSASAGFEGTGAAGTGLAFTFPPATAPCTPTCGMSVWPANTLVTIGQPMAADLAVTQVLLNSVNVVAGNNLQLSVTPTFRNYGLQPANNFFWKAYLSTDRVVDGADTLLYTSSTPLSVAAISTGTATATMTTTTAPGPGQYYVLVQADTTNVVTEASETNNVGSTDNYFVNGLDLVATGITGPANSGPGNSMTVHLNYFNQGTTAAGSVTYRVLVSTDATYSTGDFVLYTGTKTLAGGQTISEDVTFTVPDTVPGGDQFYLLQLDPTNAVAEASETNNVVASAGKVSVRQADIVNHGGDLRDVLTGVSTRTGYFGQPTRVSVNLENVGGADAKNFKVGVVVSRDLTLSLLSDTLVHEENVVNLMQSTSQTVDFTFTMPLNDRSGAPFATGPYYVFFLADSALGVTELNEGNNNVPLSGPVTFSAPASDLTVLRIDAPAAGGVGEVLPVYRSLKNIGNVAAGAAKYRYYASANAIIDPDDTLLPIVSGATTSDFGTVTLAVGANDTQTDLVRIPASLSPGTYYLGCIIDGDHTVAETDETNNALSTVGTVQIAASSLRVTSSTVPDAIVGRPYSFRLNSAGVQGTAVWTLAPSSGALPDGLMIDSMGLISGTPTTPSTTAFTVLVTDGAVQAVAVLVMRVLPSTTELEVTTTSLPAIINSPSAVYDFGLSASGGAKPYRWRISAGALPGGANRLKLDPLTGQISGSPAAGTAEGNTQLTVEVSDSLGSRASKQLTARVVALGSIYISANALADGLVGSDYTTDIVAKNTDMTAMLVKPITWRIVQGQLPDGLTLSIVQDVAVLSGTPTNGGVFNFAIQVEDGKGRSDTADLQLRIYPARLKVSSTDIPTMVRPGDAVAFTITAGGGVSATYRLFSGSLPPGVTLNPDGTVTGTVADADAEGSWAFLVEATDANGATGLGAFGFRVEALAKKTGCAAAPGVTELWLLSALVPVVLRRRKKA